MNIGIRQTRPRRHFLKRKNFCLERILDGRQRAGHLVRCSVRKAGEKIRRGQTGCDFLPPPAPSVPALPDDLRKDKTFFAANDQPALEVGHRWALHILRTFDLSERPRLGFKGRGTLPAMQKRGIVVENSLNRAFRQFDGRLWCWLQARSFFSAQRMATIQRL